MDYTRRSNGQPFKHGVEFREAGAVDRVDSHAKASSYSSVYAVDRNCADL